MSARAPLQKLNSVLFSLMLRELQLGACSAKDLAEVSGMGRPTVRSFVQTMHRYKCLHIVEYECDRYGRQRSPIYAVGEGRDKARRPPQTYKESNDKFKARKMLRLVERLAA